LKHRLGRLDRVDICCRDGQKTLSGIETWRGHDEKYPEHNGRDGQKTLSGIETLRISRLDSNVHIVATGRKPSPGLKQLVVRIDDGAFAGRDGQKTLSGIETCLTSLSSEVQGRSRRAENPLRD